MRRLIPLAGMMTCRVTLLASVSAFLFSLRRVAIFSCCNVYVILNTAGVYVIFHPSHLSATLSVGANSLIQDKLTAEHDERLFRNSALGVWGYASGICCHLSSHFGFGVRYSTLIIAAVIANWAIWKYTRTSTTREAVTPEQDQ